MKAKKIGHLWFVKIKYVGIEATLFIVVHQSLRQHHSIDLALAKAHRFLRRKRRVYPGSVVLSAEYQGTIDE